MFMYEEMSIWSGNSDTSTSKRDWTWARMSASSLDEMKLMARPFVPNRPALPTRCKYWSEATVGALPSLTSGKS